MSRPLRIEYAGAIYHAIARGNNRARIIHDEKDARSFLTNLDVTCDRFAWRVYAWCIMPNHYHLVFETLRPTLSRGMQSLNGRYAQQFNRRYGRVGHVFQARFKSFVVERERYLLALLRYVELNPCRAGLVDSYVEWPWSSVHCSLGLRPAPAWSAVRDIWDRFGTARHEAIAAYDAFLTAGLRRRTKAPPISQGVFVGSEAFARHVQQQNVELAALSPEIPREQRSTIQSLNRLANVHGDRDEFARAAYSAGHSLRAIASRLGVHYSTVSRIANRGMPRMRTAVRTGRELTSDSLSTA